MLLTASQLELVLLIDQEPSGYFHADSPEDLVQPGHVFPLARPGSAGESRSCRGGCRFSYLGGIASISVICEILKSDGSMARLPTEET